MRREKRREKARVRVRTQRDVLRDVMLSAKECGAWLTLSELAAMTRYPAASISAQLRHLKKPQFGNFALEKRMRDRADIYSGNAHGVIWEYRLVRRRRVARACGTISEVSPSSTEQGMSAEPEMAHVG